MEDMSVLISVPIRKAHDKAFEKLLLEKWRELIEKREKKEIRKLTAFIDDDVVIFGERVPKDSIAWDMESYLKKILEKEAKIFLDDCSEKLKIPYAKLSIKRLKSKWWSCSSTQNISLNLELIHLEKKFLEYVCIHEACHLKEKNHSRNFWKLVEVYMPEYKEVRAELKKVRL